MNELMDLTKAELQRVAHAVFRRYCDVRAGRVPSSALLPWLTPTAASTAAGVPTDSDAPTPHARLGPVVVLRMDARQASAVAAFRQPTEGRTSVLVAEFEVVSGRLGVRRVGEMTRDRAARHTRTAATAVGPDQPAPALPPYIESLLGEPDDGDAFDAWAAAASVIDTYRERYGVTDPSSAFGRQADEAEQRLERARALEYVRAMSREQIAAPGRDDVRQALQRPGPDLSR